MSVNGVTGVGAAYPSSTTTASKPAETVDKTSAKTDIGVVYEPSTSAKDSKKVTDYSSIVANMKQELSSKNAQLQNLVNELLGKQATKYTTLADLFKNITADPATIEQAQKDIGEDGYWGVEQTSDRLVSMAQALSGGDASKADEMIAAIEKGFSQATKAWGDDLPDICRQTVDAATEKLNKWKASLNSGEAVEQ